MFFWLGVYSKAEKISLSGGRDDSYRATVTSSRGLRPSIPEASALRLVVKISADPAGVSRLDLIHPITPEHAPAGIGKHALGVDRQKRANPRKAHNSAGYRAGVCVNARAKEVVRRARSAAFCTSTPTVPPVGPKGLALIHTERQHASQRMPRGCFFHIPQGRFWGSMQIS